MCSLTLPWILRKSNSFNHIPTAHTHTLRIRISRARSHNPRREVKPSRPRATLCIALYTREQSNLSLSLSLPYEMRASDLHVHNIYTHVHYFASACAHVKVAPGITWSSFYITPTLSSHYMVSSGDSTEKVPATTTLSVPICSQASELKCADVYVCVSRIWMRVYIYECLSA